MPRGFSPIESVKIQDALLRAGMDALRMGGIRKTSVQSLTKAARISTGEFYAFFPSKEALFFRVYELLEDRLRAQFIEKIKACPDMDLESLRIVIVDVMLSDDMRNLVRLIKGDELEIMLRGLDEAQLEKHRESDRAYLQEVFLTLGKNLPITADPDLILAYLQALFALCYEKNLIGPRFQSVLDSFVRGMLVDLCQN